MQLDGPLSRIGTVSNQIILDGNDKAFLDIEPNGLLEDRMSVKGELILISQSGHRWTIELEYTALDDEASLLDEWREPGKLLGSAGIICVLWILVGMYEGGKKSKRTQSVQSIEKTQVVKEIVNNTDAWGRSLDEAERF